MSAVCEMQRAKLWETRQRIGGEPMRFLADESVEHKGSANIVNDAKVGADKVRPLFRAHFMRPY